MYIHSCVDANEMQISVLNVIKVCWQWYERESESESVVSRNP